MDVYDREVERLTKVHEEDGIAPFLSAVFESWSRPDMHGYLFGYCTSTRTSYQGTSLSYEECGCLTQVRSGNYLAATALLTNEIRKDNRVPDKWADIRPEHLPVFAEWQRKLDAVLNRQPPEPQ